MAVAAAAILLVIQLIAGPLAISGRVVDPTGMPIAGARVGIVNAGADTTTAPDGTFLIVANAAPATLVVSAPGFAGRTIDITATTQQPADIVLQPRGITETLTVSAPSDRARVSSPAAVTVLDATTLESAPALTLDEQLRSVPGFSLFRRSSSRVANPTTQGVTLRGLAASGASRATVSADGVPLTDPFGGWVYWDRVPAAAIERVEVARGGASDVYGSDAMGGAIRIETASSGARLVAEAGQDRTARLSGFAGYAAGRYNLRGGAEQFTTDGFVTVEPESRGPIDVPADSRHTALFAAAAVPVTASGRIEVRGGYFSEDRGNGTPFQMNATTARDLSLSATGGAFSGLWTARGVLTSQDYDQTFSAVLPGRTAERPTSSQRVESSSRSLWLEWLKPMKDATLFVAASGRQVTAELSDLTLPNPASLPPSVINAIQRTGAISSQLAWSLSQRATLAAGLRGEIWSTQLEGGEGKWKLGFFAPRVSFAYRAAPAVTIRVSVQDAYRLPTINELYRPFRVGNISTLPNPGLLPEESYGADASLLVTPGAAVIRATGYFASVNDAIVNVTINDQPGLIVRQRDNAGHIRATGFELESELRFGKVLSATASAALVSSTFTGGGELDGLRVPQVPRAQFSAGLRARWAHAAAALDWRYAGSQFDDDRNQFLLRAAAITDARASWIPRTGMEAFVALENAFDTDQDVGRTPLRTVGLPRTARLGLRLELRK